MFFNIKMELDNYIINFGIKKSVAGTSQVW